MTEQRPMHQRFGVSTLRGIAKNAESSALSAADIDSINRSFGPILALATSYHKLPEAGTPEAYEDAPTIDPAMFRSDLASVKASFEKAFRMRITTDGEKFTNEEIAVMKSIERAQFSFDNSKSENVRQWENAQMKGDRKPHSQELFVSTMMTRHNGRDPDRGERVRVGIDYSMGTRP